MTSDSHIHPLDENGMVGDAVPARLIRKVGAGASQQGYEIPDGFIALLRADAPTPEGWEPLSEPEAIA